VADGSSSVPHNYTHDNALQSAPDMVATPLNGEWSSSMRTLVIARWHHLDNFLMPSPPIPTPT